MEVLCSEESAAVRHAPLIWDRGWLSGGRSRSQPVHSPAPDTHFHGTAKVLLWHSVLSRKAFVNAPLRSSVLSGLSCTFAFRSSGSRDSKQGEDAELRGPRERLSD